MELTSNVTYSGWNNVSHYAHVSREDKLNERLRKEANEKTKELMKKIERKPE